MATQKSLFGNINDKFKEMVTDKDSVRKKNAEILAKVKMPKVTPAKSVRVGSNRIATKVEMIKQTAGAKLVDKGQYELIQHEIRFRLYMANVRKTGWLSLDTETKGLNTITDGIVGACMYTPGQNEKAVYVPLHHTDILGNELPNQISPEVIKEEFLACIESGVKFIFANAKFDIRVMQRVIGVYIMPYWDCILAGNFLNENELHGLKYLWNKYVNKGKEAQAESFDKLFEGVPFNFVPLNIAYLYAAKDAIMTWDLFKFQEVFLDPSSPKAKEKKLDDTGNLYLNIEMPLIPVLAKMEDSGVCIDTEFAKQLADKYKQKLVDVEKRINDYLKTLDFNTLPLDKQRKLSSPVNIGSTTQLGIILYDMFHLESPIREKPRGTGEEILQQFANDHPEITLFSDILEYREYNKLLSTYIEKMPNEVLEQTGRLHALFNQYGAKTGRFSSSDPNLQNIPSKNKEIRKMFIASPGHVLVGSDFSQQEPRVLAFASGDKNLINAYKEGRDLYAWMGSMVYKVPYEECKEFLPDGTKNPEGKKRRDSMKNLVLGLMYGRGVASIAQKLHCSNKEAQVVIDALFNTFPGIKETIERFQKMVHHTGYVQTIWGRKRRLPDFNLPEYEFVYTDTKEPCEDDVCQMWWYKLQNKRGKQKFAVKQEAFAQGVKIIDNGGKIAEAGRQVLNSFIQGSSADITKKAMLALGTDKQLQEWGFQMILTVHDEVIAECPEENALKCGERMAQIMIAAPTDRVDVPMKCDVEITRRWYGEEIADELKEKYAC